MHKIQAQHIHPNALHTLIFMRLMKIKRVKYKTVSLKKLKQKTVTSATIGCFSFLTNVLVFIRSSF